MSAQEYEKNNFGKVVNFKEIKKDISGYAKVFSEGNKELEKLLIKMWENDMPTIACCGCKRTLGKAPYISFSVDQYSKPLDIALKFTENKQGKKIQYDPYYFSDNNPFLHKIITIYDGWQSTDKFYKQLNEIFDKLIEEKKIAEEIKTKLNCTLSKLTDENKVINHYKFVHKEEVYSVDIIDRQVNRYTARLYKDNKEIVDIYYELSKNKKNMQIKSVNANIDKELLNRFLKKQITITNLLHGEKLDNVYMNIYNIPYEYEYIYKENGIKLCEKDAAECLESDEKYNELKYIPETDKQINEHVENKDIEKNNYR